MNILKDKTALIAIAATAALLLMGYANVKQVNSNKQLSTQIEKLSSQLEQLNGKSAELQEQVDDLAQQLTAKPRQLVAGR
ncbi:hypothetical protein [Rheinheimera sp. 1928-s]|uniref:hypothetical protein n=1 Tax=Rheinheimera sp. 1928-s TaxID=3033803 RepID=UPI0026199FE0|nr:hypothetical protein [Rheinheimera sp. 1928-s]MDF3126272.1 hypothetical protein [Rheinheimera sp. 1928-s]